MATRTTSTLPTVRSAKTFRVIRALVTVIAFTFPAQAHAQQSVTLLDEAPIQPLSLDDAGGRTRVAAPRYSLQAAFADAALLPTAAATSTAGRSDGKFQLVLGAFLTAAGTDIATTMYYVGQGSAREVAFGGWWQDRPVAFAVTKSAAAALFAYQLQKLHKRRPKTAMVLGIVGAGFEASLVARTARIGSRARQAR